MGGAVIAVADINALWRKKPFEALAQFAPVLGLAPQDIQSAWRKNDPLGRLVIRGNYAECSITLPPGWASKWTKFTGWRLWEKSKSVARVLDRSLSGLVVTSPHYLDLVRRASRHVPCFYYCSDDYAQYAAWGGEAIVRREAELVRAVPHSFFVSRALADRAVRDYGVPADRVSVSPNATEEIFLKPVSTDQKEALVREFPQLRHPLVGVVGGINDRLDFELIERCTTLPEVGSVVMVGGVDAACRSEALHRLQMNPRCLFVGQRAHAELPAWMQMLDVALIPYRDTPLNRACSPMRLYDHMASGRPIVASSACAQMADYPEQVRVGADHVAVADAVVECCKTGIHPGQAALQKQEAERHLWNSRAEVLARKMEEYLR